MIHAVVCTDIEKWFGAGDMRIQVLRGLSLEIPLGEMAMIEGPSGCGKTTLISIMAGLLDASGGGLEVLAPIPHRCRQGSVSNFAGIISGLFSSSSTSCR